MLTHEVRFDNQTYMWIKGINTMNTIFMSSDASNNLYIGAPNDYAIYVNTGISGGGGWAPYMNLYAAGGADIDLTPSSGASSSATFNISGNQGITSGFKDILQVNGTSGYGVDIGYEANGAAVTNVAIKAVGATNLLNLIATAGVRINSAYTLPASDGTAGYVLTTNGSGVVSWQAGGGGGLTWPVTAGGYLDMATYDIRWEGAVSGLWIKGIDSQDTIFMSSNATNDLYIGAPNNFSLYVDTGVSGGGNWQPYINIYKGGGIDLECADPAGPSAASILWIHADKGVTTNGFNKTIDITHPVGTHDIEIGYDSNGASITGTRIKGLGGFFLESVSSGGSPLTLTLVGSSVSINGNYTIPGTDGTVGQVLTTNGAGVATWQTPSGGGGGGYATVVVDAPSGDATTDTSNIQSALTSAGAGGRVVLREGTYQINSTLDMLGNQTLEGQGIEGTTLLAHSSLTGAVVTDSTFAAGPKLCNMTVDANGTGRAANPTADIDFNAVLYCRIWNLRLENNCAQYPLRTGNRSHVYDCFFFLD
ncbi:MAG: hypothetical protein ACWGQW_17965, partial [bacterium]